MNNFDTNKENISEKGCFLSSTNGAADFPQDGIVLYAKQSGITSFTSLWAIKHALNTSKVGHTGTLDNFADGLLVVLSNRMTKFVSHITDFDKTYEAIIKFGEETDTLDIDGSVIETSDLPRQEDFINAVQKLTGKISQKPPIYSAIQVKGRRASDLVRSGKSVDLKLRDVTIYKNEIIEFTGNYAHIKVFCSKGTYIRSLARDLAELCGVKAHLVALRRTQVGAFKLCDAAGFDKLPEFCIKNLPRLIERKASPSLIEEATEEEIQKSTRHFTPELAKMCGFNFAFLKRKSFDDFLMGKPLYVSSLQELKEESFAENVETVIFAKENSKAEILEPNRLCGLIKINKKRLKYVFVIQDDMPVLKPVNHKKPIPKKCNKV